MEGRGELQLETICPRVCCEPALTCLPEGGGGQEEEEKVDSSLFYRYLPSCKVCDARC